jgi:hypothetical protein
MFAQLVKSIRNYFAMPTADAMAFAELEEAKRKLLTAQTGREYADSMCKFHEAQIKRLTVYVSTSMEAKQ